MNIYIFLPYNWSYCGGMSAVTAETFEEAKDMLTEYFEEESKKYSRKYDGVITRTTEDPRLHKDCSDQWLLERVYPLSAPVQKEVIVNFNYG